jgi:subfamily B ATP-binding cassette protein MsbA
LTLLTTWLRSGFSYLAQVYSQRTQHSLAYQLRKRIYEQLQALKLSYFTKTSSGALVSSLTNETSQVMQAFAVISTLIIRGSTLLVYVVSMLLLSWQLTIISVMLFSLVSAGISTLMGRIREVSFEKTKAFKHYTSVSLEFINGIRYSSGICRSGL